MEKSIVEMARGAIMERVDLELSRVMENIMDANTRPDAKRSISLTIEFVPDNERQTIRVSASAKSKLVPTNPVVTGLYVTGAPGTGELTAVELTPNIPGQLNFDGNIEENPPILKLVNFG